MCCLHASTRSTLSTLGVYPNWNVLAWPLSWIDICCWSNCNPRTWCTNGHWLQESKVLRGQLQTYPAVQRATKYATWYTISSLWDKWRGFHWQSCFHSRLVEERRQSTVKHSLQGVVNTCLFHLLVISQSSFKFFAKQNIFNSLYIILNLQLSVNLSRTHRNPVDPDTSLDEGGWHPTIDHTVTSPQTHAGPCSVLYSSSTCRISFAPQAGSFFPMGFLMQPDLAPFLFYFIFLSPFGTCNSPFI